MLPLFPKRRARSRCLALLAFLAAACEMLGLEPSLSDTVDLAPGEARTYPLVISETAYFTLASVAQHDAEVAVFTPNAESSFLAGADFRGFIRRNVKDQISAVWLQPGVYRLGIRNLADTPNRAAFNFRPVDSLVPPQHQRADFSTDFLVFDLPPLGATAYNYKSLIIEEDRTYTLDVLHTGTEVFVMSVDEFLNHFQAGLPFSYFAAYSLPQAQPSSEKPLLLDLPAGRYELVVRNSSSDSQSAEIRVDPWVPDSPPAYDPAAVESREGTSDVRLSGYLDQPSQTRFPLLSIENKATSGHSGTLRLEIWIGPTLFDGIGPPTGYLIGTLTFAPISAGGFASTETTFLDRAPPFYGSTSFTYLLREYDPSHPDNVWPIRDYAVCPGQSAAGFSGIENGRIASSSQPSNKNRSSAFATEVPLNSTTTSEFLFNDRQEFFRVEVPEEGWLAFFTTGLYNYYTAYLYDGAGFELDFNDNSDAWHNFRVSRKVPPGTYYLRVEPETTHLSIESAYGLNVSFAPASNALSSNPGYLTNLSVRSETGVGAAQLAVGYAVAGNASKPLLLRAIGPTLHEFGITSAMADPRLEVFEDAHRIAMNQQWSDGDSTATEQLEHDFLRLGAFPLARGSKDAALLFDSPVGPHSVVVAGTSDRPITLIEVYDAEPDSAPARSRLVNLSTRSWAGTGDRVLTAGFAVTGGTVQLMLRAVGGTLADFGVTGVMEDPYVFVRRTDDRAFARSQNSSWFRNFDEIHAAEKVGAFPLTSIKDDCLLFSATPGVYTAELLSENGGTGIALLEIYEIP